MSTELAVFDFTPVSTETLQKQVRAIQEAMKGVMQDGVHFGVIPGCGNKPTLLKPGAEKLCLMFRLVPTFEITRGDLVGGHREYQLVCTLKDTSNNTIGQGVGCATTMESKHRHRSAERKCPSCGKNTIIKGKEEYGGGFICYAKKGGCGAKFGDNDKSIVGQQLGQVENPDIADVYNTVLKMAKKRAHVDAVLTCTAASDCFTQDIEDFPQYEYSASVVSDEPVSKPKAEAKAKPEKKKEAPPAPPQPTMVEPAAAYQGNPFSAVIQLIKKDSKSSLNGKLLAEIYFESQEKMEIMWASYRPMLTTESVAALKAARDLIKIGSADELARQAFSDEHGYEPESREAA